MEKENVLRREVKMLDHFIGKSQLSVMLDNCKGEEGEYFKAMIEDLKTIISTMPKTYETDGQGDEAKAILHYFNGASDWWIVEKDAGSPDDDVPGIQEQDFGFVCLNGDAEYAELGYINIEELIQHGVELDLYYTPETIGAIKARFER
ncbi:MAG: hypothetical protein V1766_09485 [Pseudomonadota bacterium]